MTPYKLIHNRILLYILFLIALADFLYLVSTNDIESASFLVLVGILTAFFSKNMIVIFSVSLILTNVLKYGKISKPNVEGLENKEDEPDDSQEEEEEEIEDEGENALSVENTPKKEKFGKQDKDVVTTSIEEKELEKSDKMILAQEKILERMNKYKPLLDTLNGLTKNIAIVKGLSNEDK